MTGIAQLNRTVELLNKLNGLPTEPYTTAPEFQANAYNLHIDSCNGGVKLEQMASRGTGTNAVSNRMSKRESEIFMRGMLAQKNLRLPEQPVHLKRQAS